MMLKQTVTEHHHDLSLADVYLESELNVTDEYEDFALQALQRTVERLSNETYRLERIIYAVAYGMIIVLSFFGNLLVCKVCWRNMTKTNALIVSLAASDLLMTAFNIPFNFFRLLNFSWPFGATMCFVVNFVQHLVVYISSYTMAVIAFQRYRSVCGFRFRPNRLSSFQSINNNNNNNTSNTTARDYRGSDGDQRESTSSPLRRRTVTEYLNDCCVTSGDAMAKAITCVGGSLWRSIGASGSVCTLRRRRRHHQHHSIEIYSLRAISITIAIVWLLSAAISALFTYTSTVVERKDFSALFINLYYSMRTNVTDRPRNKTDEMALSDEINEKLKELERSDQHSMDVTYRCQNPIPRSVHQFLERYSLKADLVKSVFIFVTQYFIPLAISCWLYVRIGKIITRQGKMVTIRGNPKARIRQKKKRRRILVLVMVCASFAICWLPINVFHLFTDVGIFNFNYQIFMAVHWLAMSSVSVNSFIYCWKDKNFRKTAIRIFCCCCVPKSGDNLHNTNSQSGAHAINLSNKKIVIINVPCFELRPRKRTTATTMTTMTAPNMTTGDFCRTQNDNGPSDTMERTVQLPLVDCVDGRFSNTPFSQMQSNASVITETSVLVNSPIDYSKPLQDSTATQTTATTTFASAVADASSTVDKSVDDEIVTNAERLTNKPQSDIIACNSASLNFCLKSRHKLQKEPVSNVGHIECENKKHTQVYGRLSLDNESIYSSYSTSSQHELTDFLLINEKANNKNCKIK